MSKDKKKEFPRDYTDWETGSGTDWYSALSDLKGSNWERGRETNVKIIMEHYCFLTKHGREIPRPIQVYIATAFWNYLVNGKKLETAFLLKEPNKGRKAVGKGARKHPYFPNKEVVEVIDTLARKGCSLYKATELVNRKLKTPISTIRDMCEEKELRYATIFMVQDYENSLGERIPNEYIENLKKSGYYFKNINYAFYDDDFLSAVKETIERNKKYKELGIKPPLPDNLPF
jgi:hypothetical protein